MHKTALKRSTTVHSFRQRVNILAFAWLLLAAASPASAAEIGDGILRPADKPNAVQQQMMARKYGMFIHFGINTFQDQEWTDGTKPAASYAPPTVDTDQWARTAKAAGMKYVILITKHHDGFCLWDSARTDYDVASSANRTDVVAAMAQSCRKEKLQLGLYYSLWDRHEACYTNDARYVQFMLDQLTELLDGRYGPICELWLDGGWEKKREQWNIPAIYAHVKKLQPACAVGVNWSIGRPENADAHPVLPADQRDGFPIRYFPSDFRLGDPYLPVTPDPKLFTHDGQTYYLPFESTVCLNSKWFFNTGDTALKSVDELEEMYRQATAQDNVFILNSPPNRDGVMPERNVKRLRELAQRLGLVKAAPVSAPPTKPLPDLTVPPLDQWRDKVPVTLHATKPDYVVFVPEVSGQEVTDTGNEHFLVFDGPKKSLLAVWTQSTREGEPDQHIVFS